MLCSRAPMRVAQAPRWRHGNGAAGRTDGGRLTMCSRIASKMAKQRVCRGSDLRASRWRRCARVGVL